MTSLRFLVYRSRVRRGAAWLDTNKPGWLDKIDPVALNIREGSRCILGQVTGSYKRGRRAAMLTCAESAKLGFTLKGDTGDGRDWLLLTDAWLVEVRKRLAARPVEEPTAIPQDEFLSEDDMAVLAEREPVSV